MDTLNLLTQCKLKRQGRKQTLYLEWKCPHRYLKQLCEKTSWLKVFFNSQYFCVRTVWLLVCPFSGSSQEVFEMSCKHRYSHQTAERQVRPFRGGREGVTQYLKGLIKETRPVCFCLSVIAWWIVWEWREEGREGDKTGIWGQTYRFSHIITFLDI